MIGNEAAIGVIYSGEAIYTQLENPNLEYVSKGGFQCLDRSWVIPKNAKHKESRSFHQLFMSTGHRQNEF